MITFNTYNLINNYRVHLQASSNANDLVLIRTVVPIVFNANVRAVRLPNRRQATQSFENQEGRIAGWGATGTGDSAPNQHLRVAVSFLNVTKNSVGKIQSQFNCFSSHVSCPSSHAVSDSPIQSPTTRFASRVIASTFAMAILVVHLLFRMPTRSQHKSVWSHSWQLWDALLAFQVVSPECQDIWIGLVRILMSLFVMISTKIISKMFRWNNK